jgi:hypothetical protein
MHDMDEPKTGTDELLAQLGEAISKETDEAFERGMAECHERYADLIMATSIDTLLALQLLQPHTHAGLAASSILSVGDIVKKSRKELLKPNSLGQRGLHDVELLLEHFDLRLRA